LVTFFNLFTTKLANVGGVSTTKKSTLNRIASDIDVFIAFSRNEKAPLLGASERTKKG